MPVSSAPDGLPDEADAAIPDPAPQTLVAPDKPPTASAYSGPHFVLGATGSIFKLGPITVIGREEPSAQIDFDGYPNGKYVSHRHAQITENNGTFYIEDLDSANHTYVNDIRLSSGQSEPLHEGDSVRLGKLELVFHEK
jgi:pSer/pThr/pTyr-binding forkhead associated (FHA) protein